jgi:DNA-directed RNA polymerase specialized sigma24 family protein
MPPYVSDIYAQLLEESAVYYERMASKIRASIGAMQDVPGEPTQPPPEAAKKRRKQRAVVSKEMIDEMKSCRDRGLSVSEIANRFGVSVNTVYTRLKRKTS